MIFLKYIQEPDMDNDNDSQSCVQVSHYAATQEING